MENNNEHNIKKGHFDAFVHAVGSEIEQAQVRLITAANAQMLFHYWKMGNYILYHQHLHGWGGKIIKKLAQAIRFNYPEKKGYSERNLTYMAGIPYRVRTAFRALSGESVNSTGFPSTSIVPVNKASLVAALSASA